MRKGKETMVDVGKQVMESMFGAWCDGACADYICELTGAAREQKFRIEQEIQKLVNRTEHDTFSDGFYIGMAVAHGKIF